jgi:hypothetical protein
VKRLVTITISLLALAWAAPAFADDEPTYYYRTPEDPQPEGAPALPKKDGAVRFGFGVYSFSPHLTDMSFSGAGIPRTGGGLTQFNYKGGEFGVRNPGLTAFETRLSYITRHTEIGVHFFYAGHIGDGEHASNPAAAAIADGSTIQSIGGGLHGAVVFPLSTTFIKLGADVGGRGYWVDLVGDELTTCHSKYGSQPCPEKASTADVYFQPRLSFGWNSAAKDSGPHEGAELSVWGGPDLASSGLGYAFGIGLALAYPHQWLK